MKKISIKNHKAQVTQNAIIELSVIMPCLNEEYNVASAIESTLKAMRDFHIKGEIIIIDDGSTDHTLDVAKFYGQKHKEIIIVKHSRNLGIGESFRHGIKISKGRFITMIPSDNENNLTENLRYFALCKDVDIIIPFIVNTDLRSRSRRAISTLYNLIINLSFGINLNYTNGTVIYNKKLLDATHTKSSGFFYQTELLIKLIRSKFLYAEVPHMLSARQSGKSKALTCKSFLKVMLNFFSLIIEIHIQRKSGRRDYQYPDGTATMRRYKEAENSNEA